MIRLRQRGIRSRLALLYSGIFAVGLSVFCTILFQYFQRTQIEAFDSTLYNFAVDISTNLEMDFIGRLFVVNSTVADARKSFPFHLGSSFVEIRDKRGRVLLHHRALGEKNLPLDEPTLKALQRERAIFQTIRTATLGVRSSAPELRLLTYYAQREDWREPLVLQVAVPLDLPRQERRDLLLFFLLGIPAFLLVGGLAGVWMSKRALKPVHDMTLKAQGITGVEKLKERIPVPEAHDEIHELAETFNGLLDRLEKAFASQDRFVSNASHQLKTPLTILKGELGWLRKAHVQGKELADGLESATAEIDRLIQLVQDLLLLARLEGGRDTISLTPVRLDEVLLKVVARLQKLAKKKSVQISTHLSADRLESELENDVLGDEDLLGSMLENFIENAVKYSPAHSTVELELRTLPETVEVVIRDQGPGIPRDLSQKVFERFSRVQPSNIIPGSGLGLSIASEIARIHNAGIELTGNGNAQEVKPGTVVRVTFRRVRVGQGSRESELDGWAPPELR